MTEQKACSGPLDLLLNCSVGTRRTTVLKCSFLLTSHTQETVISAAAAQTIGIFNTNDSGAQTLQEDENGQDEPAEMTGRGRKRRGR